MGILTVQVRMPQSNIDATALPFAGSKTDALAEKEWISSASRCPTWAAEVLNDNSIFRLDVGRDDWWLPSYTRD